MPETMKTTSQMTPDVRAWLLAELRFPVMATIRSDGLPSLSVIWFDIHAHDDGIIVLNTLAGRVKHRHLQRDPRMSLCFEDGNDYVTIEGTARLDDDPERGLQVIQDLARRYEDDPDPFQGQHRITIEMRVERVIFHH